MRRRVLLCLTLIFAMSACNGDKIGQPIAPPSSNAKQISDAVHSAGNPDFFFLPPMVSNASSSALWNSGGFNPGLAPTVAICALSATTEAAAAAEACAPAATTTYAAVLRLPDEHYAYNWKVPTSSTIFYRIVVNVGAKRLGFADVETGSNSSQLKNVSTAEFIPLSDGRTLPIKFRIERYALCEFPGDPTRPCSSVSADLATTPVTLSTGTPDASGISDSKGVTIPAQGGTSTPVTVTLASCPTFIVPLHVPIGECVRVTVDPALQAPLTNPATVFICTVGLNSPLLNGIPAADRELVTLFRSDAAGIAALPHAPACNPGTPGGTVASANPTLREVFASLTRGEFRRAAGQAMAFVAPKPLYAAMFIDLGGGGFTESFSDFQFEFPPFTSGFEASQPSFGVTGYWHPSSLSDITNTAYPAYVSLAPGDNSNGALPSPFAGARSLWFGDDPSGNYAGPLASTQDGGTSTAVRSGTATSPALFIPNTAAPVQVSFRSWFEIESVNSSGFDLMDVSVREVGSPTSVLIARLNPGADPGGNSRTPFTSGGFNLPPVWQQIVLDLSPYRGKQVTLEYSFNTVDLLYNGYRGWIVDDVMLKSTTGTILSRIPLQASFDVAPTQTAPARTWKP
ncbi:MAG: hypothetical protein LH467_09270 [Gemmatimonadaceae bacterium]|nr:hypothetical protein [Gemmatimonadaceae bacterium]